MRPGDFLLATFAGDPAFPAVTHPGEIRFVDAPAQRVEIAFPSGTGLIADFSPGETGPWLATDENGREVQLEQHDIYVPQAASPALGDVALLHFADGTKSLCFVESIADSVDVQLYETPFPRLSLSIHTIVSSEWAAHPAGEEVTSIMRCVLDNSGPSEPPAVFVDGWWSLAARREAHAGRVGGAIQPFATVIHTTDQPPETWANLIRSWTTSTGGGACAHFALGRTADEGLVQLVPITLNANHAGGSGHGSFVAGQQSWHPNRVSVGIEIHCAGGLRQIDGAWRFVEDGVAQGEPIPDEDVIPDSQRPGRGWHTVTDYQYAKLSALLDALEEVLEAIPEGCVAQSLEQPPSYGRFATGRLVGHVSLTAAHRADPWPPTCRWMRTRLGEP